MSEPTLEAMKEELGRAEFVLHVIDGLLYESEHQVGKVIDLVREWIDRPGGLVVPLVDFPSSEHPGSHVAQDGSASCDPKSGGFPERPVRERAA